MEIRDWYSLVREIRANESFVYSLQEFWTNHKISLGNRRSMLVERMERSLTKARWVLLRQLREPVVFAPESLLRSPWLLSLVYSLKESSLELLGWETTFNRCSKVKVFFVPTSVPSFLSCSLHSRPLFLEFGKELGSTCDREAWWKKGKRWQWIHSLGRDLSQTERIVEKVAAFWKFQREKGNYRAAVQYILKLYQKSKTEGKERNFVWSSKCWLDDSNSRIVCQFFRWTAQRQRLEERGDW